MDLKRKKGQYLGTLKTGQKVFGSNLQDGLNNTEGKAFVSEVLATISHEYLKNGIIRHVHDFSRSIGKSLCIATNFTDIIVFAQRLSSNNLSRFVKNRKKEKTTKLSVVLKYIENTQKYSLLTAYFGPLTQPEVWDEKAHKATGDYDGSVEKSKLYWGSHALVYLPHIIVPGTETTECPW